MMGSTLACLNESHHKGKCVNRWLPYEAGPPRCEPNGATDACPVQVQWTGSRYFGRDYVGCPLYDTYMIYSWIYDCTRIHTSTVSEEYLIPILSKQKSEECSSMLV